MKFRVHSSGVGESDEEPVELETGPCENDTAKKGYKEEQRRKNMFCYVLLISSTYSDPYILSINETSAVKNCWQACW